MRAIVGRVLRASSGEAERVDYIQEHCTLNACRVPAEE